jgi:hypothetical protein
MDFGHGQLSVVGGPLQWGEVFTQRRKGAKGVWGRSMAVGGLDFIFSGIKS